MLGELRADCHHRIECGHRLLRYERDVAAKQRAAALGSELHEVLVVEAQRAAGDREPGGQGMCDRATDHRLAGARLADDAENTTWRELERKSPDHLDVLPTECGGDGEIQSREDGQALPAVVSRTSSVRRSPSPSRLNPATVKKIAAIGNSSVQGASAKLVRASAIICPHAT